jgi:molybdopterin molybdotransferase
MADLLELEHARRLVLERARPCPDVRDVPLADSLGHALAGDMACAEPWPTADRSAMDGFALHGGDGVTAAGTRFRLRGAALAGHPFGAALGPGEAVRIMTGGVVPAGADRVAMVEDTDGFVEGAAEVALTAAVAPDANIRREGSEVAAGSVVLRAGTWIGPAEVGALAVLGQTTVAVVRRPRVVILSTGDEVVDVTETPALHQVRDSNSWALAAKVQALGGEAVRAGIVGDDRAALRAALERGLEADVLVTVGGVSKGTHDLVHGQLRELGVEAVFHGVALKPGKPTYFGLAGDGGTAVFGLPGNPASSFTTFDLFVAPFLVRFGGGAVAPAHAVRLGGALPKRNRRAQAVPARLATGADGMAEAVLSPVRPSGDPFGLLDADGYAVIPAGADPAALGAVPFLPCAGRVTRA